MKLFFDLLLILPCAAQLAFPYAEKEMVDLSDTRALFWANFRLFSLTISFPLSFEAGATCRVLAVVHAKTVHAFIAQKYESFGELQSAPNSLNVKLG